jgi:hypothetical protein
MKQIKNKYKEIEELNPRNTFFGGRTNATKLKENEIFAVYIQQYNVMMIIQLDILLK